MSQGDLPEIFGLRWEPETPLEFVQPLPKDAARSEVLAFVAQRHDPHLFLVANIWDHLAESEPETFEGPSWLTFSNRFLNGLDVGTPPHPFPHRYALDAPSTFLLHGGHRGPPA